MPNESLTDFEVEDITQPQESAVVEAPPEPVASTQNNDELRESLKQLTDNVSKLTSQPTQQTQKSPDEIAEEWGVWNPEKTDPEFFRKFMRMNPDMDKDEAAAAINDYKQLFGGMQKGLVKQAIIGALKVIRENDLKGLDERLSPIQEHYSSQRAEKMAADFYGKYPALKDDEVAGLKFSGIVDGVARSLAGKDFQSQDAYFKALADGAAEKIKGVMPSFALGAVKAKPTAGTSPRLPRTSVGGTGGTGSGGGKPSKATDDDSGSIDW